MIKCHKVAPQQTLPISARRELHDKKGNPGIACGSFSITIPFRAACIIYGGAAEATEQTLSLLSKWLLAEIPLRRIFLSWIQFPINVSA